MGFLFRRNVFLIKTLILTLAVGDVLSREWDTLVQDYFPNVPNNFIARRSRLERMMNPTTVTQADINLCIKQGQRLAKTALDMDAVATGEKFPSPAMWHFFSAKLPPEVEIPSRHSKATLLATKILQNKMAACEQITPNTFVAFLEARGFKTYRFMQNSICPLSHPRSLDGSCNNRLRSHWGSAFTPFTRIAPSAYNDGLYSMPIARSGNLLPSPRKLSTSLFSDQQKFSKVLTNMVVHWGQLVAHDMSMRVMEQSANDGVQCCQIDGSDFIYDNVHSACAPIAVPPDDPFLSHYGIRCLNYVRSITAPSLDGSLGPAQQMNAVSSFLDGSTVYSSRPSTSTSLRTYYGGKLILSSNNLLPSVTNPEENCDTSNTVGRCPCYSAGDTRVNQTPTIAALQTLMAREHNRLADSLRGLNPHWTDEKIFQEARKIVIAQIQHITYHEWLPLCIGKDYVQRYKISPASLFSFDYDSNINPGIINGFATGAFRFFHTLITNDILLRPTENYGDIQLRLSDHYFKPGLIESNGLDAILRGAFIQPAMEADHSFSSEITNFLFRSFNQTGIDLIAIDIQRGRDHGLAKYNEYRAICGLKKATNFEDLSGEIPYNRINLLKSLYESVDDIDLFVGGTLESDVLGSLLGPTFQCIVGEQFYRTRAGDSHFYDFADMPHSFTADQLREIKKTSMARLLCDNSDDIKNVQSKAFETISSYNPTCSCYDTNKIPFIDLRYWSDVY